MGSELPFKWGKDVLRPNRKIAGIFTAIATGQGDFRCLSHEMGLATSPLCRHCEEDEEIATHVLWHCAATTAKRPKITSENFLETQGGSMEFTTILTRKGNCEGRAKEEHKEGYPEYE